MSKPPTRRPTALRLDEARFTEAPEAFPEAETPDPVLMIEAAMPVAAAGRRRRFRWARLFVIAASSLFSLALALGVDWLVRTLFERWGWFGWVGLGLAGIAVFAAVAVLIREIGGLLRLRRIDAIHREAAKAAEADDRVRAAEICRDLMAFYVARPETARSRKALAAHLREVIDGRDLLGLAERELLLPFDEAARRMVMSSAQRVSIVTAMSPRAVVDVLFVLVEATRLIRSLARLYGGRPGLLGFLGLARNVGAHLAVTGGIAAGDSIIQQIVGHGIAARLSSRLGEGVINGLLTARVGIAAIEVCRPLPFIQGKPTRLGDVMAELTKGGGKSPASPGPVGD